MALTDEELDLTFGPEVPSLTLNQRIQKSRRRFMRGQDQLIAYNEDLHGRIMSAWEVCQTYGVDAILDVDRYGSAVLRTTVEEPAITLRTRREQLGLTVHNLSKQTGLNEEQIYDAENPATRTPIRTLERIAQALVLDERLLSFVPGAGGDPGLATRLKALGGAPLLPTVVSRLCEAAWVIKRQYDLFSWRYSRPPISRFGIGFQPDDNYGIDAEYPAWRHGYWLAEKARVLLGIAPESPIESLRELIEDRLEMPLVQLVLPINIGGATITNGSVRGIAVNLEGDNYNVWVRRITLAHELGHILYDSDERLQKLRVDQYVDLQADVRKQSNRVEARANAFAVEFLAPRTAVEEVFRSRGDDYSSGLRLVMETFGLSYMSAKFHVWNACERDVSITDLVVDDYLPTEEWISRESFATTYIPPEIIPSSRIGRFACLVEESVKANLLTEESAATCLGCNLADYKSYRDHIRGICGMSDDLLS